LFFGDGKKSAYDKYALTNLSAKQLPCKVIDELPACMIVTDIAGQTTNCLLEQ
jgi:hypothetical protein